MKRILAVMVRAALLLTVIAGGERTEGQTLDEDLRKAASADLVRLAKGEGDATRGAIVFFQHHMACSKCHSVGGEIQSALGPDLAAIGKSTSDESLVESVLSPSKVIRKGFETSTIITSDGMTFSGLVVERTPERVVFRDVARGGVVTTLQSRKVDQIESNPLSIMPQGQVNQLAGRQQFFDLIQYLMEVRDGGAARARELQPSPALLTFTLPDYEREIDHAAFIMDWDTKSLKRGEAIYQRVCANCHGTKDAPGSLPTSLRFAEGKFKNGGDPWTMYQTLTRGFGLMAPQTWMVPSQKYDVIHYIRETYLKPHNPAQFFAVDSTYLNKLPKGKSRGPEPSKIGRWSAMDYGPSLTHTYEVPDRPLNIAYKGIAARLDAGAGGVSRGRHWMMFDTDTLRVAAAWSSGGEGKSFIDWRGIQFNGEHQVHPRVVGPLNYTNSIGPGWADSEHGIFLDDRRIEGRDGRRYGPLPREWGRFRGLYHFGQQVVLSYTVGSTEVLESPGIVGEDDPSKSPKFLRTLNVGPRDRELVLQIAEHGKTDSKAIFVDGSSGMIIRFPSAGAATAATGTLLAGIVPRSTAVILSAENGKLRLRIPAGQQRLKFAIWTMSESPPPSSKANETNVVAVESRPPKDTASVDRLEPVIAESDLELTKLIRGGPPRWPQKLKTAATVGSDTGPFAVDVLTAPESNPWLAQTRFTGLDFLADGRVAVCSWDGDVWLVDSEFGKTELSWRRIATGLYQPLGLKIVGGAIHVICRDQLAVLRDLNGDDEIDFYECLNNDHQVTEHFHEFAMGLQTDASGNFYYAKSGRHALPAIVPHHGTLLRVARDGSRTDILATGFRAANGVCLNPDGSFVVTDQEGFWNPKNRINWVTIDPVGKPKFYGNMFGYTDVTDTSDAAMEPPLCWITNAFDRSPAELLWVEGDRWGPLKGSLLNLSYGFGKVFVVPHEKVGATMQGGMIELPIPPFPTGVMRGRFHPADGQLYLCGMFSWAGSAIHPGGLYRLRATGRPMGLPVELRAAIANLTLKFSEPLDPKGVDAEHIQIKTWSLKRTAQYGSKHYDDKLLAVRGVTVSEDGKILTIQVPDLRPTWCMEIKYDLRSADGLPVKGVIHNTIHELRE